MVTIMSSVEAHYYEERITNEEPSEQFAIDPDKLAKIDKTAPAKEVSKELAFLYAERMAKMVDEELKSLKEAEEGLTADKRTKEYDEVFKELLESVQVGTTEGMLKKAIAMTTKESYSKLVVDAIDWAAKSPGFYTGMQMAVSRAAMEMGREDINPCRIDTSDVEDAAVLFSKRVLEYGLPYGVTMPGHLETNIRKNVAAIKIMVDRKSCASYG